MTTTEELLRRLTLEDELVIQAALAGTTHRLPQRARAIARKARACVLG